MKALDEFGSVLAIAGLILGACAAAEMVLLTPAAAGVATAPVRGPSSAASAPAAPKLPIRLARQTRM